MGPGPRGPGNVLNLLPTRPLGELQWGRDRAVPEMRGDDPGSGHRHGASMGPGPRGPGNPVPSCTESCASKLQWGRDRAVPEISEN